MNIVNVGYDSTNYYVLGQSHARLLVDVGWPGTLPKLLANLKRKDIPLQDIRYLLVTHYHPDHAGLAQEVKDKGVRLIVLEQQIGAIPVLKTYMKPANRYVDIKQHDNLQLTVKDSRTFLKRIGIEGEIISTPGHSDDSVTLVLDEGAAFTGDLPSPALAVEDAVAEVTQSWTHIRSLHARLIYPGHGPVRSD
ncbi:MAG: MBL fold metallo-hydrolase [Chloroflexi bacterium]|nr:MBL fold metallo-hydrolase [Chloroflexota bacterium]